MACRDNGTRRGGVFGSSFTAFLSLSRTGGIRQVGCSPSRSNSFHSAARSSPGRTNHNGANFNAHATVNVPLKARSEEHTSELQSLMRISYAVFCLQKKINIKE